MRKIKFNHRRFDTISGAYKTFSLLKDIELNVTGNTIWNAIITEKDFLFAAFFIAPNTIRLSNWGYQVQRPFIADKIITKVKFHDNRHIVSYSTNPLDYNEVYFDGMHEFEFIVTTNNSFYYIFLKK